MNQTNHAITYVSDEHRKMVAGEWYLPFGPELGELRHNASMLAHEFNQLGPTDPARSRGILGQLFGNFPESSFLIPPASIDYGIHTFVGEGAYINFNATILDSAEVHIGDRALIGPNCQLITVGHPVDDVQRRRDAWEQAAPIHIGEDAWLGAGVTVLPGVSIGARSVIGAGSVVTRSIPDEAVAVGNPAKVIRDISKH
jgi:maltose o-acetyltransferase